MNRFDRPAPRAREAGRAALVVFVLLVAGAAAAAYFLLRRPAAPKGFLGEALRMAPESTQVFLAVDFTRVGFTEDRQKQLLGSLAAAPAFQELDRNAQENLGVSVSELLAHVEPTLALAIAPLEGKTSLFGTPQPPGGAPPMRGFLAVGLKDEQKATEVLQKIKGKAGSDVTYQTETYSGAMLHVPAQAGKGPTWTIHEKKMILGVAPQDVKLALDGRAGTGRSLADAERYQTAVSHLKHTEAMVAYVDVQGLVAAAPLDNPQIPAELKQFVGGLRGLAAGSGLDGNDVISDFTLDVDPKAGGPVVGDIFKPSFGIDMKTVELFPMDTEVYGAFNAKAVWQAIYDVMGRFPEGKMAREVPSMQLQQQGINLQADVLDALTGEVAYSMPNYSQIAAMSLPGSTPDMSSIRFVVALTLAKKDKIQGLIDKVMPPPVRSTAVVTEHQGVKIETLDGKVSWAFVDDFLVIGVNDAVDEVKKTIDARKSGKTIKSHPGYDKALAQAGGKPVLVSYADPKKVYGGLAKALDDKGTGLGSLLQSFTKADALWQAWTLRADGIYGSSVAINMAR